MKNLVFSAFGSIAMAVLALGLTFHTASAQEATSHQMPPAVSGGWGSGPIMASLLVSARQEAPIRGVEPSPSYVPPVREIILVLPKKVEPTLPTMFSVEALEQSIATAASTDFAAKADRQIALSKK
jgi:hypothetical protein